MDYDRYTVKHTFGPNREYYVIENLKYFFDLIDMTVNEYAVNLSRCKVFITLIRPDLSALSSMLTLIRNELLKVEFNFIEFNKVFLMNSINYINGDESFIDSIRFSSNRVEQYKHFMFHFIRILKYYIRSGVNELYNKNKLSTGSKPDKDYKKLFETRLYSPNKLSKFIKDACENITQYNLDECVEDCPVCLDEHVDCYKCPNNHVFSCKKCIEQLRACPLCRRALDQ